ncbi:uncharacterized protein LOC121977397 [Zingiber officinale]|uniref:Uncharacterized protein n=1 Tax=Zingiber officinale TaxID=94328 RepID=A0A8J5LEF3_ZINOF|nr:uncharacterized protein LOC121977397 [Zingiber officinale]KAG6509863.1 hypothetical protein ZIOFF_027870 [Zingiber officinale]
MIAGFRRSISLPGLSPSASPSRCRRRDAQHTRSASFPCRSHPVLSLLHDEIRSLRASADLGCYTSSASAAATVFERIDRLLASLDDLLRLSQTQDSLRRLPAMTDLLLDDFLRLADAQGSYRSAAIVLAQHAAEARAASRRRDTTRLTSAARSLRRAEKDIAGLVSGIKDLARSRPFAAGKWEGAAGAEVAGILAEAVAAIGAAMTLVFSSVSQAAAAVAASMAKEESRRGICGLRKKTEEGEEATLEMLEERLEGMEEGCEKLFRSLINIRVSLLNIITPSV